MDGRGLLAAFLDVRLWLHNLILHHIRCGFGRSTGFLGRNLRYRRVILRGSLRLSRGFLRGGLRLGRSFLGRSVKPSRGVPACSLLGSGLALIVLVHVLESQPGQQNERRTKKWTGEGRKKMKS